MMQDGHDVRVVSNAADAIDLAHLFQPDLLITEWDLESDDYGGFEVAEACHAANANIKTIVFSGRHSNQNDCLRLAEIHYGKDIGLTVTFSKPVSIDQLARAVSDAMQASHSFSQLIQMV